MLAKISWEACCSMCNYFICLSVCLFVFVCLFLSLHSTLFSLSFSLDGLMGGWVCVHVFSFSSFLSLSLLVSLSWFLSLGSLSWFLCVCMCACVHACVHKPDLFILLLVEFSKYILYIYLLILVIYILKCK